jgi:hypothetical protein
MIVAAVLSAWVQYASDGKAHARALATKSCPVVRYDGSAVTMTRRAPIDIDGTRHVALAGHVLPAPARRVDTVVVFGDTGCRMKGGEQQNCGDLENWPFPRIARQIAAVHPDLAVHVGDYYYRENNCPPVITGCVNYWGDTSASWTADWFDPAAPVFAAVPLVLTRGNHEDCARGGPGWFRFLEPSANTACPIARTQDDGTPPYAVNIDGLRIIDLDSASDDSDIAVDPVREAYYRRSLDALPSLATGARGSVWVVTHRPPYANANMAAVLHATPADFGRITTVIAGHVHDFATLNLSGYPPLVVNGEGGDDLDDAADTETFTAAEQFTFATPAPFATKQFGFAVYRRQADGWSISLRDPNGIERETCSLTKGAVRCQ